MQVFRAVFYFLAETANSEAACKILRETRLGKIIYDEIKPYVTSSISKKVSNLMDVYRMRCEDNAANCLSLKTFCSYLKVLSKEYIACVKLKFIDGSMIAIDTVAVENEIADNMYQRS